MTDSMLRVVGAGLTMALCLLLAACQSTPGRNAPAPDAIEDEHPAPRPAQPVTAEDPTVAASRPAQQTVPQDPPADRHMAQPPKTVFERLAAGFDDSTCSDAPAIERWMTRYRAPSRHIARQLVEASDLLGHVLDQLEAAGLPTQFALIPLIESDYRPDAKGRGGPLGLWQIMPATGRGLGLRIDGRFDGRLSAHPSTVAAVTHLGELYRRFGDWRAAAMAYNAGEYRLLAALRAAGANATSAERRLPAGLAPITYDYVAKLRALACLVAYPERHGLDFSQPDERPKLTVLELPPGEFDLSELAAALATDIGTLKRLNGGHRTGRILASSPRMLLVPTNPQVTTTALASLARAPVDEHEVKPGDSLWKIARQHGLRLADLMTWNNIPHGAILKPGRLLRLAP